MSLIIDRATQQDMDEIFELAGENRKEATGIVSTDNKEEMIKSYEHSFQYGAFFIVGKHDNELVGWVLVDKSMDWFTGKEVGWISDVYVKKEFRKKGYAKELIERSFSEFKALGYNDVRLNVFTFNEKAIKLYEKIGFTDVCKFMKIEI